MAILGALTQNRQPGVETRDVAGATSAPHPVGAFFVPTVSRAVMADCAGQASAWPVPCDAGFPPPCNPSPVVWKQLLAVPTSQEPYHEKYLPITPSSLFCSACYCSTSCCSSSHLFSLKYFKPSCTTKHSTPLCCTHHTIRPRACNVFNSPSEAALCALHSSAFITTGSATSRRLALLQPVWAFCDSHCRCQPGRCHTDL